MPKSIVIVDDHAFFAAGIARALSAEPDLRVVGTAANGIEAIALIKRLQPDCVVLDLAMAGANGVETFHEARRWSPSTRFAILTANASAPVLRDLIAAGVAGVFLKTGAPEALCDGIRRIAVQGVHIVSPEARAILDAHRAAETLTGREIEVLHAIARGLSNTLIAQRLGVSAKTVDSHRTNLMRKMGVHSTATLLVRAMRDGLLDASLPD
ncbi:MAG: response regulator transcription factor [Alphaproteobacteria bacterium]|nr:response regulator transcription factor [Alphaproteobacteria bacterium]MCB9930909.1 response regulator transcription factor [Alphaproteobacteria bacterium]